MSSKKSFSLAGLVEKVVSRFKSSGAKAESPTDVSIDSRNPWAYNLERLSRHRFPTTEVVAETQKPDELTSFVSELAQKAVEHEVKKTEAHKPEQKFTSNTGNKRLGDKTINDMKSWWEDAVVTGDEQHGKFHSSELPGKPRLMKRWFE